MVKNENIEVENPVGLVDCKKHILLIDDDDATCILIEESLEDTNYELTSINDGIKGFNMFNNNKYDLVLLDIRLPGLSGFELCSLFKEIHPSIPIIAYTACCTIETEEKCYEAGFSDILYKPQELSEIIHTVNKHLLLMSHSN